MAQEFGIYLNTKTLKVLRISSPYWMPPAPDWVLLTSDTNATLLRARELAKKKGVTTPESVVWGELPKTS